MEGDAGHGPGRCPERVATPLVASGADPWVVRWADAYYYCRVEPDGTVRIGRAATLADVARAEFRDVWTPPPGTPYSHDVWAPELHRLDGRWYVYVAAGDGDNRTHRMHVLVGPEGDPRGDYRYGGTISDAADRWAIDGTVAEIAGRRYFVWSSWPSDVDVQQDLTIAAMVSPTELAGTGVRISSPEHPWERVGRPVVNEAPQLLTRGDRTFLVYSASGSWTDDYCLGRLELVGADPLDPASWVKHPEPVFARTADVQAPGHACFVTTCGGTCDWIVYHAAKHPGAGWDRDVRAQRFTWAADGTPDFGRPVPPDRAGRDA